MQKCLFNIYRLSELKESTEDIKRGDTIHVYFILKGCLKIVGKPGPMVLESNTLFWTCCEKWPLLKMAEETEGYVLLFNKALLQSAREELYWSFIAAFCPFPGRGEKIPMADVFLNEGRMLCEMMLEEYKRASFFKMEVLRGLLSIFLLYLFRRSDLVMFVAGSNPGVPVFEREAGARQRRLTIINSV